MHKEQRCIYTTKHVQRWVGDKVQSELNMHNKGMLVLRINVRNKSSVLTRMHKGE